MKNKKIFWLGGRLVQENEAKINILSPSCQYGINFFEVVRCYLDYKGRQLLAFRLNDHISRLFQSAKILRLKIKYTPAEIKKAFTDTVIANSYKEDISVRIFFFINKPESWSYRGDCEMLIAPVPKGRVYDSKIGINACISSWERINDLSVSPRVKAGANYLNSRMAQLEAIENGYDTAIFLNRENKVCEAPGACIFIVRGGKLVTSTITSSILESITRDTIIKIAKNDLNLEVSEREIDRTELYICDEIFLCGTTTEIVPVISVDKIVIKNGTPGEITKKLEKRYFEIVRGKVRAYNEWLLAINEW
jgi:branched-chain amino acid aminotransferase